MKYEPKWKQSAEIMKLVLFRVKGGHRELSDALRVSRSFIDEILRGGRPIPPRFAAHFADKGYIKFDAIIQAHMSDVGKGYFEEARKFKARGIKAAG